MADGTNVDGAGGPGGGSAVVADPPAGSIPQTPAQMAMHRRLALMAGRNETKSVKAAVHHKKPKKSKKPKSKRVRPHKA